MNEENTYECNECCGSGKLTVYHKVTHQLGHDELPFDEECEVCEGRGRIPCED